MVGTLDNRHGSGWSMYKVNDGYHPTWIGETTETRQNRRDDQRAMAKVEAAQTREILRAAERKKRGIVGGSKARKFSSIDLTIEAVRNAVEGAGTRGIRSRTGFLKLARRLYNGKKIDRPWRSYPREPGIVGVL